MIKTKLSLGAGSEIETGEEWINLDMLDLPGIEVVWNLVMLPLPWDDNTFEYIKAKDVIEHLPSHTPDRYEPMIVAFIEDMYRILKPGGVLFIQTPSWKADFLYTDPTHVRGFTKETMDFFDPTTDFGKSGGFISKAKFKVTAKELENKNLQFTMTKI